MSMFILCHVKDNTPVVFRSIVWICWVSAHFHPTILHGKAKYMLI